MIFGALSPTERIGIQTDQAAIEFAQAFANGHAAPAEFACRTLLSSVAQFFDRAGHKQPTGTTLEGSSRLDQHRLERVCQFHCTPPAADCLEYTRDHGSFIFRESLSLFIPAEAWCTDARRRLGLPRCRLGKLQSSRCAILLGLSYPSRPFYHLAEPSRTSPDPTLESRTTPALESAQ